METGPDQALVLGLADFGWCSHCQLNRYPGIYFSLLINILWHVHILHQVRSGYRVTELSYGYQGFLATTEAYFYLLDALPLVIANLVYIPCWPGRFIHDKQTQESVKLKSTPYSSTV